ncbi:MAG: helix-turn-helix transcriptional regulator [Clostridia bacterium]|nr:helix-turn-helix transcriptional regulator [Clostridia bacterium]
MTFAEKVKFARMKLLLSQEALANELGVSLPTITRWEKGNRTPQAMTSGKFYMFCEKNGIKFDDMKNF